MIDPRGEAYVKAFEQSMRDPDAFWAEHAENIVWTKKWDKIIDDSNSPFTKWFPGGRLSVCYNAVDRHLDEGHGDDRAFIWDSAISGQKQTWTYKKLQEQVSKVARVLSHLGVERGDRVLVYMPMIPETVVGMLAASRLGAVHSVVFGGTYIHA